MKQNRENLIKPRGEIKPREKIIERLGNLTKEEVVEDFTCGKEGDKALRKVQEIIFELDAVGEQFQELLPAFDQIDSFRGGARLYAVGVDMPTSLNHINKQKLVDVLSDVLTIVGKDNPELNKNLKAIERLFDTKIGMTVEMGGGSKGLSR